MVTRHSPPRGYPIGQLAENSSFMEVCYLLLTASCHSRRIDDFTTQFTRHTMLHEQLANSTGISAAMLTRWRHVLRGRALSAFYHDSTDIADPEHRKISSHRLLAKMPTIAAMAYKYSVGQPFLYPKNDLSYTANFMRMTFGVPAEEYELHPAVEKAMDRIFILHADHEQNASTSTVRLAGSSGANPFACVAAGIACLWGPAARRGDEAARNQLHEIGTPTAPALYRAREGQERPVPPEALATASTRTIPADGDAKTVREVFDALEVKDPVFETAMRLEELELSDDYFREKLFPMSISIRGSSSRLSVSRPPCSRAVCPARTVGLGGAWNEMIPSRASDRPSAPALHRPDRARLRSQGKR